MKNIVLSIFCFFNLYLVFGQETATETKEDIVIDSLYREDQFYVGLTYNIILNRPNDVSQSGFAGGLHFGFTRDMPINKRRNVAVALGIGYSLNVYNHNLRVGEEDQSTGISEFSSLKGVDFNTNRFTTHLVEAPLEFRWRTSVPESHKFYRIYTGLRLGYMHYFRSSFRGVDSVKRTNIGELERWRFGATFTFGWNTFNFHFYYSLNSLFTNDAIIDGEQVGINPAKVGLIFYIL